MVANGEQPASGQLLQHGEGVVPQGVTAAVVHQVAGLDGQVKVRNIYLAQNALQVRVVALLQVAQHQGLDAGVLVSCGKALHGRPVFPIAHTVVIGGGFLQILCHSAADIGSFVIRESGELAGARIDFSGSNRPFALGNLQLGFIPSRTGVREPTDIQTGRVVRSVAPHAGWGAVFVALGPGDRHGEIG